MACLEQSVCRSLKLVKTSPPTKPILAGSPARPRFPKNVRLITDVPQIVSSKPKILTREGNVSLVSVSQMEEHAVGSFMPQLDTHPYKSPNMKGKEEHAFFTENKEKNESGHAGADIRQSVAASTSTCKGLQNLKRGKFDQLWLVKWMDWYKFLVAMTRKTWDVSVKTKYLSETVRAETAKMAWSS